MLQSTQKRQKVQDFWNDKFKSDSFVYGEEPNEFVKESYELIKSAKSVLCLGEGEGRNAIFLAKKGLSVLALDASDIGLLKMRKKALSQGLEIGVCHTLIENWQPAKRFDVAICTYLHLPKELQPVVFEKACNALKMGGLFIFECFSESQLHFTSGGPKDKKMLYTLNEISSFLSKLPCTIKKLSQEIVVLNEGENHKGEASVIRLIFEKNITE